ncbi:hypothetical protein [Beijerinckia sp. L45]|uniref:hypothetical protein n=1 Tax=Beijerinckia sp. L45 TaxID=1641855 RepID=UPI00131CD0FD|nr:hypothetical protein [Beijerinckia sp. L45]
MMRFAKTMFEPGLWGKLATLALLLGPVGAQAQMMLPGAMNGAAPDQPPRTSGAPTESKTPAKPISVKPPGEDAILGRLLSFDGAKGSMQFDRSARGVTLTKLTLPGERLSKPSEACQVDIVAEQPIVAADLGRPAGALRWSVAVEACPFTVDVLDGAALVSSAQPTCDFVAADCRVSPIGLWGPSGDAISPQRIKDLEHERVRAETTMRANFRVLLHRAGKDRAAVKAIAGEQAAFSSQREMTCRDYARESVHGFCSAQITEARSLAILAKFADEAPTDMPKKHAAAKKPPPHPKAAKAPEPVPGAALPASQQ